MLALRSKKGFTLIELLLVVSLIGVLVGMIIYFINPTTTIDRATRATCKQIGKTLIGAMVVAKYDTPTLARDALLNAAIEASDLDTTATGYTVTFQLQMLRVTHRTSGIYEDLKLPATLRT